MGGPRWGRIMLSVRMRPRRNTSNKHKTQATKNEHTRVSTSRRHTGMFVVRVKALASWRELFCHVVFDATSGTLLRDKCFATNASRHKLRDISTPHLLDLLRKSATHNAATSSQLFV